MSAPYAGSVFRFLPPSITNLGSTTFPRLLDILCPFSSNTKPCVRMVLYGAAPFAATDVSRDDWNHPLCWSEPSRYTSAG